MVSVNVPSAELGPIRVGESAEVRVNESATPIHATVSFVSPQVDAKNGTALVRATLATDSGLRAGEFLNLQIVSETHSDCLAVPVEAVVKDAEGVTVIAIVENGVATQKQVEVGLVDGQWMEVKADGLEEGMTVVTVGAYALPKQTKVRVTARISAPSRHVANPLKTSALGQFAIRHRLAVAFISVALCVAGAMAAMKMSSSVFPQTNFPRVVILVDNGVMPADEMMATITRPIEEAMKDIPGSVTVRSVTGRGSAEISVFFTWQVDMIQSELYVNSRISEIRSMLPATASTTVWRLTFSAFPIIGVSLTSPERNSTELWETARYELKPRFLRIPGVARVDLVGGRTPEYHVIADPLRLQAVGLSLSQVTDFLSEQQCSQTHRHARGEPHTVPRGGGRTGAFGGGNRRPDADSGEWSSGSCARFRPC